VAELISADDAYRLTLLLVSDPSAAQIFGMRDTLSEQSNLFFRAAGGGGAF
jgi:hypothetical protein